MKKKRKRENNYLLLGFNPYSRAHYFLNRLEGKNIKIDRRDNEKLDQLWKRFKHAEYKLRTLKIIRLISFILLYSSIVSAMSSTLLVGHLKVLTTTILELSGIIGSTFFVIIVAITSKFIEMYLGDIYILTAKMVAIYSKYEK